MKILILDDDALFTEQMIDILKIYGHQVEWERSAQGFLQRVQDDNNFDVFFIDRMLRRPPDLKVREDEEVGDAVVRELRRKKKKARVVFVTAKPFSKQKREKLGPHTAELDKPFAPMSLLVEKAEAIQ